MRPYLSKRMRAADRIWSNGKGLWSPQHGRFNPPASRRRTCAETLARGADLAYAGGRAKSGGIVPASTSVRLGRKVMWNQPPRSTSGTRRPPPAPGPRCARGRDRVKTRPRGLDYRRIGRQLMCRCEAADRAEDRVGSVGIQSTTKRTLESRPTCWRTARGLVLFEVCQAG